MNRRTSQLIFALGLALATACSQKAPEPHAATPTDRVRNIDLPFARRSGDSLGSSAPLVLIAFDAIAIDGHDLVPLTRGAMTPAQSSPAAIPAIASAIPTGTNEVRVRMHTSTKLPTLLAVVVTLRERGVARIGFDVRKDALGENTGTLAVATLDARAPSTTAHVFDAPYSRAWDQIPEVWDDAFVACNGSEGSFNCSAVTDRLAFGGDAEIALFRRHNGVILDMRRFGMGGDIPAAEAFMNQQNDRRGGVRNRDRDREALPPATSASFGFRSESLSAEPMSPLAAVMRALTQAGPVGVRVSADANSDAGAVLSLIGAAFPDGVTAPAIMLDAQAR